MNEKEIRSKYSEADNLYSLISNKNFHLTACPSTEDLQAVLFREIKFTTPDYSFTIPVDDEYGDADSQNQALLLQLIIYAIEEYEECEDYLVWSTAYGLDASNTQYLGWYKQMQEVAPIIREIIGSNFTGISDFDWQLDAGAAQALRGF